MGEYAALSGRPDAPDARVAVAVSRFNVDVTTKLLDGALETFRGHGVDGEQLTVVWVPGAFELPLVAQRCASSGAFDAVVCLGAVIRGETPHFDYVAGQAAAGCTRAALDTGIPVVFGVLTTDDAAQARDRVGGGEGHKGEEAALTALEMVDLLRRLPGER